ncbi:MAG TPA: bifunctional diaminohydroxyphosphoribosylaminopyrimidine deaminase/5-amino-6-(5-phosphoribosylamino)uracil reductase RibD [Bdellovibrionota bacterium]|jgi:diaminohydroxyphosphoribosylaminopyrimidine deaminase/5-amino-6-(5-phosphoribosylamino)uracil reductase
MEKYVPAMKMALNAAKQFEGATAPNPPVGAIALDKQGKVVIGAAHQNAGAPHAEAKLLELAGKLGKLSSIETLVVTMEPCNHQGRTPPCTEAILKHKNIKRVVFGCHDPNPQVAGGGEKWLRDAGLEVISGVLENECRFLIRAFAKHARTGRPYVTLKAAFTSENSMIPPAGQKTFTSQSSLYFAHELRKRADAIWTGSGTVLADKPELTVRWLPDHPEKHRWLILSDRRRRIGKDWLAQAEGNGFRIHYADSLEDGLDFLGKNKALEVLVEAGPELRKAWLDSGLWDESVVIVQGKNGEDDKVDIQFRNELGEE